MSKKKAIDSLKTQVKNPLQAAKNYWHQSISLENDIEDLKWILEAIKNKSIIFQSNEDCNDQAGKSQPENTKEPQKDVPKKRGRPIKMSTVTVEPKERSDSSDKASLDDSTSSRSSSRSRRAAAQAAEQKLAQVQSLVQLNTKLRRPTNFDEKQIKSVSSPPAKCRRTRRNQSAGSSSPQVEELNIANNGKVQDHVADEVNEQLHVGCAVSVEKLNTPTIKSFTQPSRRSTRSLDRASERNSKDLFNDSSPLSNLIKERDAKKAPLSDPTNKINRKKSISKKDLDSGISSTEEELRHLIKNNVPIAHSSPISLEPFDGEFKGFSDVADNNKDINKAAFTNETTFVVDKKKEETHVLSKKQKLEVHESSSDESQTESKAIKSRTKVLRKKCPQTAVDMEEKENVNRNNETHIISKETANRVGKNSEENEQNSEESQSSPERKVRVRTKTIRKHNEQKQEVKSDNEVLGRSVRSRTKTLKKNSDKEDQSDSSGDGSGSTSKTKTTKTGTTNPVESEYLLSGFKDNAQMNKVNNRFPPLSPAPAKGELVKKRVEDFEKMQTETEEIEEVKTVGRVTRNAMKSKVTSSTAEAQNSKQPRNVPVTKLQASAAKVPLSSERPRMTPLGVNNRMTPVSDPALKSQANKWTSSASRPAPVETTNIALIHKQAAEESEKKRREEERLKRQAKEEDAMKKKEKVLKATSEETRRKRMEKLQKVAATREAAEKEKERLAAKAEKEKEEKMRQIALEKEKQKEEQLKKKQLMLQKTLEHEERRKQEEAARLAKLKEQEEEHKRQLAMKEREQELLKQQKAEQRLAEAEKAKLQAGKLGKIAAVNNAKLKMQGMTPSEKTNNTEPSNCYEITPAREDRPLLQPKTEDDYGIDDAHSGDSSDDECQPKKVIPAWAQSKNRERLLVVNKYIPKKLWDMFMECDPCPDINQMFAGTQIKRRIRTSSAVWRTPPKYSRYAS